MNQTMSNHGQAHWVRNANMRSDNTNDTRSPFAQGMRSDPWQAFLQARTQVIEWLTEEYNWSDEQIGRQLSLSVGQVQRLRAANMRTGSRQERFGNPNTNITMAAPLDD